jgi:hypothetical protein
MAKEFRQANSPSDLAQRVSIPTRSSRFGAKRRRCGDPHAGYFSPNFLMREKPTKPMRDEAVEAGRYESKPW